MHLVDDRTPPSDAPVVGQHHRAGRVPLVLVVSGSVGAGHDAAAGELARRLTASGVRVEVRDLLAALPVALRRRVGGGYGACVTRARSWLHPSVTGHLTVGPATALHGRRTYGATMTVAGPLVAPPFSRTVPRADRAALRRRLSTAPGPLALVAAGLRGFGSVVPKVTDLVAVGVTRDREALAVAVAARSSRPRVPRPHPDPARLVLEALGRRPARPVAG